MIIYVDSTHRVHTSPGDGLVPVTTSIFDDIPAAVIECYTYYSTEDGQQNEFVQAWMSGNEIAKRIIIAENDELSAQNTELLDAMADMVEDVYNQDVSEIEGG